MHRSSINMIEELGDHDENGFLSVQEERIEKDLFINKCYDKLLICLYCTLRRKSDNVGKSGQKIASELQELVLANKPKLLKKQQEKVISGILNIPPDPVTLDVVDILASNTRICCEDELSPETLTLRPNDNEQENLHFVQAMIKLKSLTDSETIIQYSIIQNILGKDALPGLNPTSVFSVNSSHDSGYDSWENNESRTQDQPSSQQLLNDPSEIPSGRIQSQNLSQYSTPGQKNHLSNNSNTNKPKFVFSGNLYRVMRSLHCDKVLRSSMDNILNCLENQISQESIDVYMTILKEGSMLNLSIKTLCHLTTCLSRENEDNECRTKCSNFNKNMISNILGYKGRNNTLQIFRSNLVLMFSHDKHICYDTIEFLIENLQRLTNHVRNKKRLISIVDIENSFYLFYMMKELLTLHVRDFKVKKPVSEEVLKTSGNLEDCKIKELTWDNFLTSIEEDNESSSAKSIEDRWLHSLEEANKVFFKTYATFALFIGGELLPILQET